jgi:hypothetical protein
MQRTGPSLLIFRIGTRAGVPGAGVHRHRHTFTINFRRNGGNLLALQGLLMQSIERLRRLVPRGRLGA